MEDYVGLHRITLQLLAYLLSREVISVRASNKLNDLLVMKSAKMQRMQIDLLLLLFAHPLINSLILALKSNISCSIFCKLNSSP